MNLQPIKPATLEPLLRHVVWVVMGEAVKNDSPETLAFQPDEELSRKKEGLKLVLEHLKENQFLADYSLDVDRATPIIVLNKITLLRPNYKRFQACYEVILGKISWVSARPDQPERMLEDFWFQFDTLNHGLNKVELSGYQSKLCELLFDQTKVNQRLKDQDIKNAIGADKLLDLKDLIKVLNKKLKEEFGLEETIIRQKEKTVYRIA